MRPIVIVAVLLFVTALLPSRGVTSTESQRLAPGLAGQLLVAEPKLDDPNFDHTVILVLQHDADGAMGLVVNRPYGTAPTAELLSRLGVDAGPVKGETLLFYGGPVQPSVGIVVHSAEYARADTRRVTAGIAVTSDPAILADMAVGKGPRRTVPVLGYAGWAAGQLDQELAQGSWFSIPADPDLIFAPETDKAWERALARKGIEL